MGSILAGGAVKAIGGATQAITGLVNAKKLKREQREKRAEYEQQKQAMKNFQFSNPWANMENTAEDLTVNQQASQFQAQQTDGALAQGLDAIVAGGGGGGGAQAIAAAALQSKQGISANIAAQESQNQAARAQQASANQARELQGQEDLQSQQYTQQGELLNMSGVELAQANQARNQNRNMILGGVSGMAGALAPGIGDAMGGMQAAEGLAG